MKQKSEIIIIDTSCDSLSNEHYEISIKKFFLFIMNYHNFGRELTLISKKYLEFFNDNNDEMIEYNLVEGFNNEYKKIFLDHSFPTLGLSVTHSQPLQKFLSYRKNTR